VTATVVFDEVAAATAILTLLGTATGVVVFDGEIDTGDVVTADSEGRINPYAIFYPGTVLTLRDQLSGAARFAHWGFQITTAGGDRQRCSFATRQVCAALQDQRPVIAGWSTSRIAQDDGPDMSRDDTTNPPRFYRPLLFTLHATVTS
jgi:hypothetical protein